MNSVTQTLLDGLRTTFAGGASLFRLAPLIPLLLLIPEMAQHVAEISLGMFESRETFRSLADSPLRMGFGYVKIAAVFLTLLAAARYWGGAGPRWWDLRTVAWRGFLLALAANVAVAMLDQAFKSFAPPTLATGLSMVLALATLPVLVWLVGALLGDRTMTLRRAYTRGWLALLVMLVFAALAYLPGQWLHMLNHKLAIGASTPVVWALMIWDAIWTALFVTCAGSGLGAGYQLMLGSAAIAPTEGDFTEA